MSDTTVRKSQRTRPKMKDYGIHQSDEGMMNLSDVTDKLEKSRNYWISSTLPDAKPHAAPVWGVWMGDALYWSTGRSSRKAKNLAHNPNVVVHLESGDDAVILEGKVEELTDKKVYARLRDLYGKKYPPFKPEKDINPGNVWYILKPAVIFGWLETDFPRTATRWTFEES